MRQGRHDLGRVLGSLLSHLVTVAILLVAGLPTLTSVGFGARFIAQLTNLNPTTTWLGAGIVAGLATLFATRSIDKVIFLNNLQHELAHVAMALLLGALPRSLRADLVSGGEIQYQIRGPLRAPRMFLITLAPYVFSPLIVLPLLLSLATQPRPGLWLGVLGWLLGVALGLPLAQLHPRQPDLKRYAVIPPVIAALWMWSTVAVITIPVTARASLAPVPQAYAAGWAILVNLAGQP